MRWKIGQPTSFDRSPRQKIVCAVEIFFVVVKVDVDLIEDYQRKEILSCMYGEIDI
jgi:hypothetical protein